MDLGTFRIGLLSRALVCRLANTKVIENMQSPAGWVACFWRTFIITVVGKCSASCNLWPRWPKCHIFHWAYVQRSCNLEVLWFRTSATYCISRTYLLYVPSCKSTDLSAEYLPVGAVATLGVAHKCCSVVGSRERWLSTNWSSRNLHETKPTDTVWERKKLSA